ncbi:DnaB helicase [Calothrix sp. PCC 7716]|nr:DnaB helicase [Calothrix sp. PCC 7716]
MSIEAEMEILGGIMLDPEAFGRIEHILKPEMFYIGAHRIVYQAAASLYSKSKPTDLLQVTEWLINHDLLVTVGGRNRLAALLESTVSAINIDAIAMLVAAKYQRRQMIKAANAIYELAHDEEGEITEQLEKAESKLLEISSDAITSESYPVHIKDILANSYEEIEKKQQGTVLHGLSTGFYDLDAMTSGGIQPGKLITIAGRPSMGKSSFLGCLALNVATLHGKPVIIFSLEMGKGDWGQRFLSQSSFIQSSYLQSGRISDNQWADLSKAIVDLSEVPIFIDDSPVLTVSSLRSKVKRLAAEYGAVGFVGVDYLQLMEGCDDDKGGNIAFLIGKITRQLKQLARECNTTVIILSQLNRSVESRTSKRPLLSDLRESGRIEEDSDQVWFLYRDEYYHSDSQARGLAELIVAKSRSGPTGAIKLLFDSAFTQFKNLAHQEY